MKHLGIDGDIIAYSVGFACENDSLANCLKTVDKRLDTLKRNTHSDEITIFLTGRSNFRYDVATLLPYKGNRKNKPKPRHLDDIIEYMFAVHDALIIEKEEADDALGKFLTDPNFPEEERIIATLDKDLDMIIGKHYNWNNNNLYDMPEKEADLFFGKQLLTGDATDNIPGLYRLGGLKATRPIVEVMEEAYKQYGFTGMVEAVYTIYSEAKEANPDCRMAQEDLDPTAVVNEVGHLLWIRRYGVENFLEKVNEHTIPEED